MKINKNIKGFTLVEMLVAMTIFGIVIISIIMIYSISTQISIKTDINREMQQNIKSTIETIADDVRKNGIIGVANGNPDLSSNYGIGGGTRLKTGKFQYALFGYEVGTISDIIKEASLLTDNSSCSDLKNICFIMKCKSDNCSLTNRIGPLSNSKTSISNFIFFVTGGKIPKVTINFTAKPSVKKGLASKLTESSKLIFQTTISERYLKVK